jgi:hypothetical protein
MVIEAMKDKTSLEDLNITEKGIKNILNDEDLTEYDKLKKIKSMMYS